MRVAAESTASPSPPTRRVLDILETLALSSDGAASSEIAQRCAISSSTCALVLSELEHHGYVARRDDRRYVLGSGLFAIVAGLRSHYPLLDVGRNALDELREATGGACSLSKIESNSLTVLDISGHVADEQHAVGQRFPIDPPFGSVAMAWKPPESIDRWLLSSMPRLSDKEMEHHRNVLSDIRSRGFGVWVIDDSHPSLRDRLSAVLDTTDDLRHGTSVVRELTKMLTQMSLKSITHEVESRLSEAEFIVVPVFGRDDQPEYQIEIRLNRSTRDELTLQRLEAAVEVVTERLTTHVNR